MEAFNVFQQMKLANEKPNSLTFVSLLSACTSLINFRAGESIHSHPIANGMALDVALGTALIEMYSKCGDVEKAFVVFNSVCEKNLQSWTIMISGLADNSQGKDAISLFTKMLQATARHHPTLFWWNLRRQKAERINGYKPKVGALLYFYRDLKDLLSRTRREFKDLESQLLSDLKELSSQVQEMSTAALGYYRMGKEKRNLYNMVQYLKGNIQVYCRIRPAFIAETKNVIEYIGEDGSLVISDPRKLQRKNFQFDHLFGPAAIEGSVDQIF
ncbi:Pentatricopeptide repeat-containing protein [Melia azedarach]|uniref:Pentatricopeptide repeat-containing protein n=1 Tax=Melia azedarach TaxID=155640 RepID=A0ACC1X801_MELAZ|nr:Pentatricopeptide repeat-containing protein [Melia azedarach]